MLRFAKIVGAFWLLAAAPAANASYLCVVELIGYQHWVWNPPGGSCAVATYDIAVDHCGNVWQDSWSAYTTPYDWKFVTQSRYYDWECIDGQVYSFTW